MRVKGAKKNGAIFPCIQYFAHSTLTLHVYIKKIKEVINRLFTVKKNVGISMTPQNTMTGC